MALSMRREAKQVTNWPGRLIQGVCGRGFLNDNVLRPRDHQTNAE